MLPLLTKRAGLVLETLPRDTGSTHEGASGAPLSSLCPPPPACLSRARHERAAIAQCRARCEASAWSEDHRWSIRSAMAGALAATPAAGRSSEDDCVEHCAEAVHNVGGHELGDALLDALLGVHLADGGNDELVLGEIDLLLDGLLVRRREAGHLLHAFAVLLRGSLVVRDPEAVGPVLLVKVHEHLLLEVVLAVRKGDGVVVSVEAVDEGLYRGLVQVA
mmetsp:Transcript_25166/g.54365  ORF Transcript_25166/g.54365 Transcript_25166/m.54365 type:complete len:220 (+) Transcript_25166:154-813(+)